MQMGETWITDMTHFLNEVGRIADMPTSARNLVNHLGSIVSVTSRQLPGVRELTGVKSRRRPNRRPCSGEIIAVVESDSLDIVWQCPVCADNGLIQSWQGTLWDQGE